MAKRRRQRPKSQRQYLVQNDALVIAAKLKGVRTEKLPRFIAPSLATLTDKVPNGAQWIHETKFDGYRLQLRRHENDIRFFTRRGHDWTRRFDDLLIAAGALPNFPLVLDGEVVVTTESGHSDFGALESDLGAGRSDRMLYYAFDILHIGSKSLRDRSLGDRKAVLAELLEGQEARSVSAIISMVVAQNYSNALASWVLRAWSRNASPSPIVLVAQSIGQR